MVRCPVRKTVWGPINTLDDLKKYIAKSGQFFGQDLSGPACEFNASYPCNQTLYQYMGWGTHKGLDIPCASMTEVYASHDGIVWKTSETVSQGLGIVLESLDEEIQTVYWHNFQNLVKPGDKVKEGQLIAYSDNTGFSKGNHLHWEYKVWDGNGFIAVDPIPYIVFKKNMTEEEVKKQYVLAFYREPTVDELNFWIGKDLLMFLDTAIKDRATFLSNHS